MRDYGIEGQIGLEKTPQEYVGKLVEVFSELKRLLRPDGSFYLNLGDTYCGSWGAEGRDRALNRRFESDYSRWPKESPQARPASSNWLQAKQLLGLPERVMIELQNGGWILRNKIIWHKPNHTPSSVKDRLTNSWEYVFHFVKSRRYYYDLDSIREPHKTGTPRADRDLERMRRGRKEFAGKGLGSGYQNSFIAGHPLGKNPGDIIEEPDGKGKLGLHRRIMRDCGYANQHSGYMLAGLKLKSRQGMDIRNPKGRNPGDVIHGRPVMPPHHSYRGDGWEESALERGTVKNHPSGKNPGDVLEAAAVGRKTTAMGKLLSTRNAPELGELRAFQNFGKNSRGIIEERESRRRLGSHRRAMLPRGQIDQHSGHMVVRLKQDSNHGTEIANHPNGRNPGDVVQTKWSEIEGKWSGDFKGSSERSHWRDPAHYHSEGKNPGDVVQGESFRHKTAGLRKMLSMRNAPEPMEPHAFHELGKNPGDVVQFDEAYWYRFLLAGAHPNRFYTQALLIMKEWMVENECYDYSKFYEWYKTHVSGTWDSGNLAKGKCNFFSGGKALPFPRPETRFMGCNPGDIVAAASSGQARQSSAAGQRHPCTRNPEPPGDFWTITTKPFPGAHFAVYPEELCIKPIKSSCPPGGVVLDMFAGSGTTCLVASKLGRRFIGIDINPGYVEIARSRLARQVA